MSARKLLLFRGSTPIAITGYAGAGKSVLFDALMSRIPVDYHPRGISKDWERHRILIRGRRRTRANVLIVPGQRSAERNKSIKHVFERGHAPVGVIHVVSWGFNELWEKHRYVDTRAVQNASAEFARRRRAQLKAEFNDFADLCGRLGEPEVVKRLRWLVIAVAKADLYWSEIDQVRDYYIPQASDPSAQHDESGFCQLLRMLCGPGSGFPGKLAILPFSAYPVGHTFGPRLPERRPQLTAKQVTALRNNLCDVLGGGGML